MRWSLFALGLLMACGTRGAAGPGGTPAVPGRDRARAEPFVPVDVGPAPPPARATAIFHVDGGIAVILDADGVARHTGNTLFLGQAERWLPFSEPVDDVVFVQHVAYPHNIPGAELGRVFCARTRSGAVECVVARVDAYTGTSPPPPRRVRLPSDGPVRHLGVYAASRPDGMGGYETVLCTLAATPACWWFDPTGVRAERWTLDPAAAEVAALRVRAGHLAAWREADPAVTPDAVREVVRSEREDLARIVGPDADIGVHCARLADGALSCFGRGVRGELGDGRLDVTPRASRPLGDTPVVDVAMARHHACAVTADGRVACWGELPATLPVPAGHRTTPLPACPLDEDASDARLEVERAATRARTAECLASCRTSDALDACLGCGPRCVPIPYVFVHAGVCQEPLGLEQLAASRDLGCVDDDRPARWLDVAELRGHTPDAALTLTPVFVPGVDDAIGVALPGRPSLCVLRRGGAIACVDDDGRLRTW